MEDMSDILSQISKMAASDDFTDKMASLLKNSESSTETKKTSSSIPNFENIDLNTLLKAKSLFEKMNSKDDPRTSLLLSLKPYLKESRQDKIEQYIQLLNFSKILTIFNEGDKNNES